MLRQIGDLRFQQPRGMSLENKPFMDFHKTLRPQPSPQGVEGVVGRLDIPGGETVKVVLSQNLGQLPVRQDTFFDLDDARQNQKNVVSFGTDAGVAVNHRGDGIHVDGGKVGNEILLLLRQGIEITRQSRQGKLEIDHDLPLLFNTGVQY